MAPPHRLRPPAPPDLSGLKTLLNGEEVNPHQPKACAAPVEFSSFLLYRPRPSLAEGVNRIPHFLALIVSVMSVPWAAPPSALYGALLPETPPLSDVQPSATVLETLWHHPQTPSQAPLDSSTEAAGGVEGLGGRHLADRWDLGVLCRKKEVAVMEATGGVEVWGGLKQCHLQHRWNSTSITWMTFLQWVLPRLHQCKCCWIPEMSWFVWKDESNVK